MSVCITTKIVNDALKQVSKSRPDDNRFDIEEWRGVTSLKWFSNYHAMISVRLRTKRDTSPERITQYLTEQSILMKQLVEPFLPYEWEFLGFEIMYKRQINHRQSGYTTAADIHCDIMYLSPRNNL